MLCFYLWCQPASSSQAKLISKPYGLLVKSAGHGNTFCSGYHTFSKWYECCPIQYAFSSLPFLRTFTRIVLFGQSQSAIWATMHMKLSLIVHFPNTKWEMHTLSHNALPHNTPTQSFHNNSYDGNLQRNSSQIGFCLDHRHANAYAGDSCPGSKRKINTHHCQCHIGRHLSHLAPSAHRYLNYVCTVSDQCSTDCLGDKPGASYKRVCVQNTHDDHSFYLIYDTPTERMCKRVWMRMHRVGNEDVALWEKSNAIFTHVSGHMQV